MTHVHVEAVRSTRSAAEENRKVKAEGCRKTEAG